MKFNKIISSAALFLLFGTGANVYGQHEEQGKQEKSQARPQPQQHAQQPKQQQPEQRAQPRQQQQRAEQPRPAAQPREQQAQRVQQPKPAAQSGQQAHGPQHAVAAKPTPFQPAQQQQAAQRSRTAAQKTGYTPAPRTRQQAQTWQKQSGWRQDGAWQGNTSWQQDRSSNWQADHRTWAQRGGYGGYYIPQASFSLHFGIGNWFRIQNQPIIVGGYPRFQYGGYSFLMVDPWPSDWAQNWYSADDVYVGYDNGYYLYNRQYPGEPIAITVVL